MEQKKVSRFVVTVLTSGTFHFFDPDQRRKVIFLHLVTYIGSIALAVFGGKAVLDADWTLAIADLSVLLILILNLLTIRLSKKVLPACFVTAAITFALFTYFLISGGQYISRTLWVLSYPLIAVFLLGSRFGTGAVGLLLLVELAFLYIPPFKIAGYDSLYAARMVATYVFMSSFAVFYEIIRDITQKRLKETSDGLQASKEQTDRILAHVQEGLFLLDKDLKIGSQYSKELCSILLMPEPDGIPLPEYLETKLPEKDQESIKDFFGFFKDAGVSSELLQEINPLEKIEASFLKPDGEFITKHLEFRFTRIGDPPDFQVLGTVRDITEEVFLEKRLQSQQERTQKEMETLFQVVQVDPEMFSEFMEDVNVEMEFVHQILKEPDEDNLVTVRRVYQSIHAIKGNAALLGLNNLSQRLHLYEEDLKEVLERKPVWQDMLDLTITVGKIREEVDKLKELIGNLSAFQQKMDRASRVKKDLMVNTLERLVDRTSDELNKKVKIQAENFSSSAIPREFRKMVKDICIQFTRNSLTHGIETPQIRQQVGKEAHGAITLASQRQEDAVEIVFRDDGKGLDLERIKETARNHPEISKEMFVDGLQPHDLVKLIFRPGFSTAKEATQNAGRGIGMDLIKSRIEARGGNLTLKTKKGQFTEFRIRLPLKSA